MYKKHIFVCTNQRDLPKSGCGDSCGGQIHQELKARIREKGLNGSIRVNKSGCLGFCEDGPVIVMYPEGTWYQGVQLSDIPEIVQSIESQKTIERLLLKNPLPSVR